MIELIQQNNNLIGSSKSIKELSTKDHARILVISDSHGGFRQFIKILQKYGPTCDALIFSGDGANDITEILEQAAVNPDFKACIPSVFAFVQGNGDPSRTYVCFDIGQNNQEEIYSKGTVFIPQRQILTVNEQNIMIVHGHNQSVYFGYDRLGMEMQLQNCRTAVHGHTHVPCDVHIGDYKIVNPGSISRPRGGMPSTFAILTVEKTFVDAAFIRIKDSMGTDQSYEVMKSIG